MKVMLINGSSHADGCTALALRQAATALEEEGIETETIFIGSAPLADCTACHGCAKTHKCVFDDIVNEITHKAAACDGFIFGSPVYYAHPTARLLTVLDRVVLFRGEELRLQARCGGAQRPPRRHHRVLRRHQQVFHHQQHARGFVHLLEQHPRQRADRGGAGRGGSDDHAQLGQEHGVAA